MKARQLRDGRAGRSLCAHCSEEEEIRQQSVLVLLLLILVPVATGLADLSDGLVAYYPFSRNADDASGNGHDGTVYWATLTTDRLGSPNSAYSFDGVDDYVNVPYSGDFQSADFTLAAWMYSPKDLSAGADAAIIAGRGEDFATDRAWAWLDVGATDSPYGSGIRVYYETNSDTDLSYSSGVFPEVGTWTHVAATRSGDGEIRMYRDGFVVATWYSTPSPTTMCAQDFTIGTRWVSTSISGPYFLSLLL